MNNNNFDLALEFLFPSEGGYSNNKFDKGGPTNMGITQTTYNNYLQKNNLPKRDVRNITKEEAKEIYYRDYWQTCGANEIDDPKMAIALFDTAVLHGPYQAKNFYKQSNGNFDKFLEIRKNSYLKIVEKDKSQKIFYNGWCNRVENLRKYALNVENKLSDDENTKLYGYINKDNFLKIYKKY